jgi:hypothetical protein
MSLDILYTPARAKRAREWCDGMEDGGPTGATGSVYDVGGTERGEESFRLPAQMVASSRVREFALR